MPRVSKLLHTLQELQNIEWRFYNWAAKIEILIYTVHSDKKRVSC